MKLKKTKVYLVDFQGVDYECKFIGTEGDYLEFKRVDNRGTIMLLEQALTDVKEKE